MKLVSKKIIKKPTKVYNLHIEKDHNYVAEGAVVQNCHTVKGDKLKTLLTGVFAKIPIRWGLTGTIPKEQYEFFNLKVSLGEVINAITTNELQEKGVLSDCEVEILQLKDESEYSNYMSEIKFLVTNKKRIDYVSKIIDGISKKGNTLVLVNQIKTGNMMLENLPHATFVQGSTKQEDRKETYDDVSVKDDCLIIATYGVAAVGINIPRLHNIVFLEPGKSFVRVMQSLGRGLRKTEDKNFVKIIDVCSDCKYSKRHLTTRKKYYKDAKFPFTVHPVVYK